MKALTKQEIFAAKRDFSLLRVETPEWGDGSFVYVRTMTARDRSEFEALVRETKRNELVRETLAALTVCDEEGALLFSGQADAAALSGKNSVVLERIGEAAMKLNLVSKKDVEEIEKNS